MFGYPVYATTAVLSAFIELGGGITAEAVARHPIERMDVVEIEPAEVEASRFFRQLHGEVFEDPMAGPSSPTAATSRSRSGIATT